MVDRVLEGCRVLVVEDEYMLADELRAELHKVGAVVVGPVGHLQGAVDLVKADDDIDGAVLDINLRGETVFPVVDLLTKRGIPVVFSTGYDGCVIPPEYADIVKCVKPVAISEVIDAVCDAILK